jgi:hypothetical protein
MRQIAREATPWDVSKGGKPEWGTSRSGDGEMRSAFASEGRTYAEGNIRRQDGSMNTAGLWIARRRWRMETIALKELINKTGEEIAVGE